MMSAGPLSREERGSETPTDLLPFSSRERGRGGEVTPACPVGHAVLSLVAVLRGAAVD
jgi:hypothetical protein